MEEVHAVVNNAFHSVGASTWVVFLSLLWFLDCINYHARNPGALILIFLFLSFFKKKKKNLMSDCCRCVAGKKTKSYPVIRYS